MIDSQWAPFRRGVLHFHTWDDGAVVFNETNGDTHIVSLLAAELLTLIEDLPNISTQALVEDLAEVFANTDNGENQRLVEEALLELQNIGLITQVSN